MLSFSNEVDSFFSAAHIYFSNIDSFSTPCGSIEPHILLLVFLFLDSFLTHDLPTLLFSTPARQMSRHHLNTLSVEIYLGLYLSSLCNPPIIFSISLSIDCCFLSQTLTSLPQICSTGFFKLHQAFLHVVSFYSLAFHAFMLLKPRFRDFFFFFLNCGFSKLMRYC